MENKENKNISGENKKYDLSEKIAIIAKMGIDYLGSECSLEIQKKNVEKIIDEIMSDKELIEKLDNIKDSFWDEAKEQGLFLYKEEVWIKDEKDVIGKKQYSKNEKYTTIGGEQIETTEAKEIPTLVKQNKKHLEQYDFFDDSYHNPNKRMY